MAPAMIDAAARGELDLLFASGGNFLDVLPDPDSVRETLGRIPMRVHMDLVVSSQMLVDPPPGGEVADPAGLDPLRGRGRGHRDDAPSAGSSSAPRSPGQRIAEARPEWQVFGELAARVRPELARAGPLRRDGRDPPRDRRNRAALRAHRGAARGRRLVPVRRRATTRAGRDFPTADGRAHFVDRRRARPGTRRRALRALDPARQAVQLDGPGGTATRSPAPSARPC